MKTISLLFRPCLVAAISIGGTLPAFQTARAEMTAWADNEGGRMRLIALPPDATGKIRAALQIEPKPGWITYWREPGNSGIPPQISVAPEGGVALATIGYPVPKHIVNEKVDEIAYDAPVTLPLELIAKDRSTREVDVTAFVGVCRDICIPFQVQFSLKLASSERSLPQEEAILAAANAALPQPPSSTFNVTGHSLSADMKQLSLQITLPQPGDTAPQIIVSGPSGYVFTKQLTSKRHGTTFATSISVGRLPGNYDARGKTWSVLVIDGESAIESPLAFE
jgi:DsbC/DsbD-like thiol-disulfide interchange protein